MSNQPWECPRCKRINAPFNPSCFCSPEKGLLGLAKEVIERNSRGFVSSEYPPFGTKCLICSGHHVAGVQCISLGQTFP